MDERAREATDGNGVEAEDAVADGEQRHREHLAVGLADVLGQERRGLGGHADLWTLGQFHAGLADQGNPEAGNGVRAGWVGGWHSVTREGRAGAALPSAPALPLQAAASTLRYSSMIHAFTPLTASAVPSIARR